MVVRTLPMADAAGDSRRALRSCKRGPSTGALKRPPKRAIPILKAPSEAPYPPHVERGANGSEQKVPTFGAFAEPSSGLEPETLLTIRSATSRNPRQRFCLFFRFPKFSDLPVIATGCHHGLHRGSILSWLFWQYVQDRDRRWGRLEGSASTPAKPDRLSC
jgi:hypothetical protein